MKKYIYQGNVIKDAKPENLTYYSSAELHNGLVELRHVVTDTVEYYTQQEFNKLFTIKN